MSVSLQRWRRRRKLTQVDAAALLGVSQPYFSLIEKGDRPLTSQLRGRLEMVRKGLVQTDEDFRKKLSALGYPGFAHVKQSRPKPRPDTFLLSVLSQPDVDARVVEALLWVARRYSRELNLDWLVDMAKLQNLQNRLGFVLQISGGVSPGYSDAIKELDRARLLQEDTLCWRSMPAATLEWMRLHRTPLAQYWNIVTTLTPNAV